MLANAPPPWSWPVVSTIQPTYEDDEDEEGDEEEVVDELDE